MLKETTFINGKYRKWYLVWQIVRKRVKGLDLGAEPPHIKLSPEAPPPPPGHYDLWSQSIRERNVLVLIFAVADVVT